MFDSMKILLCLATSLTCNAQDAVERQNFFNDPFFQVSNALPQCPLPAGPFITLTEKQRQTHHRAERGTSCWLAGKCDKPNSYAYDQDIAEALKLAFAKRNPAPDSALWITVQGRVVFIEGCVKNLRQSKALETLAMQVPDVQQAVALIYSGHPKRAPYVLRRGP